MRAVAAARNPADQIVAVRRRERKNLDELDAALPRQRHEHEVGEHRLRGLIAVGVRPYFARHRPQIFAVVEHTGIGHVIQAVDRRLHLEHQLRIPDVLAQRGRHL